jgi:hypothetical protein
MYRKKAQIEPKNPMIAVIPKKFISMSFNRGCFDTIQSSEGSRLFESRRSPYRTYLIEPSAAPKCGRMNCAALKKDKVGVFPLGDLLPHGQPT